MASFTECIPRLNGGIEGNYNPSVQTVDLWARVYASNPQLRQLISGPGFVLQTLCICRSDMHYTMKFSIY
jgi:hypothetical protein